MFANNLPPRAASGGGRTSEAKSGRGLARLFVADATQGHFQEDFSERWLLLLDVRSLATDKVLNAIPEFTPRRCPPPDHRFARPDPSLPSAGGVVKARCYSSSDPENLDVCCRRRSPVDSALLPGSLQRPHDIVTRHFRTWNTSGKPASDIGIQTDAVHEIV